MNFAFALKCSIAGLASLLAITSYLGSKGGDNSSMAIASSAAEEATLRAAVRQSDYAFRGTVTKIEYRNSDKAPGKEQIPHTFVTFKVEEPLKGAKQDTVTLRFVGGPDNKGRTLIVSDIPLFDVGERSILLVKNNGSSYCPLVGCDEGRFRIIQGRVYSNDGLAVTVNSKGEVMQGKLMMAKEVLENKIGKNIFGKVYSESTKDGDKAGESTRAAQVRENTFSTAMSQEQLSSIIRQSGKNANSRAAMASVDIQDKFYFDVPKPIAPQAPSRTQSLEVQPRNAQERAELEMLKQQQKQDLNTPFTKGR